jgi:phage terminase small subunit
LPDSQLTPKQERFLREYLETGNASEAYRRAYDASQMRAKTVNEQASRLLAHRKVAARLDAWRQDMVAETTLTFTAHMIELAKLRDTAKASGRLRAAVRAEELRGRLCGLYPKQ